MYRYIAIVTDANLSGELLIPLETIEDAKDIIRHAGQWHDYPDALEPYYRTNGAVLLDSPRVALCTVAPDQTARITAHQIVHEIREGYGLTFDAILETGPRGGVQRTL